MYNHCLDLTHDGSRPMKLHETRCILTCIEFTVLWTCTSSRVQHRAKTQIGLGAWKVHGGRTPWIVRHTLYLHILNMTRCKKEHPVNHYAPLLVFSPHSFTYFCLVLIVYHGWGLLNVSETIFRKMATALHLVWKTVLSLGRVLPYGTHSPLNSFKNELKSHLF